MKNEPYQGPDNQINNQNNRKRNTIDSQSHPLPADQPLGQEAHGHGAVVAGAAAGDDAETPVVVLRLNSQWIRVPASVLVEVVLALHADVALRLAAVANLTGLLQISPLVRVAAPAVALARVHRRQQRRAHQREQQPEHGL